MADVKAASVRLETVGVDVLRDIASHLDIRSLARLEQTCRSLRAFAIQHGWQCIASRYRSGDAVRKANAKDAVRVDLAWARRRFDVTESEIGTKDGTGFEATVPFSKLLLLPHGLVLVVRSELHYWSYQFLEGRQTISLANAQSFYLSNPANLDVEWQRESARARRTRRSAKKGSIVRPSATWDFCACAALDPHGQTLALARVNGLVEIVVLQRGNGDRISVALKWIWRDLVGRADISAMASSVKSGTLTICSKRGEVWLIRVGGVSRPGVHTVDLRPLQHFNVEGRIWSATFGEYTAQSDTRTLLALGTKGREGVLLFELHGEAATPEHVRSLSCGLSSVYALAFFSSPRGSEIGLLAGCFDGTLHYFDDISDNHTSVIKAKCIMDDPADSSAIYSMITGVGPGGDQVAVGTARHGVVKIYDPKRVTQSTSNNHTAPFSLPFHDESRGWTIFASYPARSPTYTLAGQHDRLFGATDSKIWQIDLRPRRAKQASDINRSEARRVAYYRHSKVYLETSGRPELN